MAEKATIFHIEDNPDNRLLVRRLLLAQGYQIVEADGALQALDILTTLRPDLILMDINMPEMDGYTLTRKVKNLPGMSTVPVIAITANVMKGDRERTMQTREAQIIIE